MAPSLVTLVAAALATAAAAGPASAATQRVALLVGNNLGSGGRAGLRFAENDAVRLAAVLVELGGFQRQNVHLLQGAPLAAIERELDAIGAKVARWRGDLGDKVMLVFYFSGHSDGRALEVGAERLGFGELRRRLSATGADVRVTVVDSCQSGALLASKGGTEGADFDIRFSDEVASTGEALLTSSAAHELALESSEIRASFFSHHLISGLRGAADGSGDGRVTLGEAYRYAFIQTLAATSNTLSGPQHPVYDYRLSGQGEVVLTELVERSALLGVPPGYERVVVQDLRDGLVAEVGPGGARRLAVPPGRYRLIAFRDGRAFAADVDVTAGGRRELRPGELQPARLAAGVVKGYPVATSSGRNPRLLVRAEAGALRGAASAVAWMPGLRLGLASAGAWGGVAELELGSGRALGRPGPMGRWPGLQETSVRLALGGFLGSSANRLLRGQMGWRLMAGPVVQSVDGAAGRWETWIWGTGPWLRGAVWLSRRVALSGSVGVDLTLLRRDDSLNLVLWPAAFAGVELAL